MDCSMAEMCGKDPTSQWNGEKGDTGQEDKVVYNTDIP